MQKMKKILLAVISLLPVLSYGQSMKISPKQIMPGANGNVIITRNGVNTLDNINWADINNVPSDLEHTSNKVTNLNSPNNTTYPTTQAVINALNLANDLRYKAEIPNGADLNNYTEEGNYSCQNANYTSVLNRPNIGATAGFNLIVIRGAFIPSYTTQMLFPANFSTGNDITGIWIRSKSFDGPGWTNWHHIATQDWVNLQGFLTTETDPFYTADKPNIIFSGDNNSLLNNDAGYITSSSIPAAQTLSISGDTLSISNGNTVTVPNLGNSDLTLSGNRILSGNGSSLTFKGLGGFNIINNGGTMNLLDSAGGLNIGSSGDVNLTSGSDIDINAAANLSFNGAFGMDFTGTGSIDFSSTGGIINFTSPAPIQLNSTNSPVQIYSGGGAPIQLSTDGGINGANISTHLASGFQNYEVPNNSGIFLLDVDTSNFLATKHDIPTVNNDTLTLNTTIFGATNIQTWTANSATNKQWFVDVAGTNITTGLNVNTGVLTTQSSTGSGDSVQLLTKENTKGYLQPVGLQGVNTGGGFAATAQTEAFNSTYIDLNDGTYTLYIVAGGNPSGGNIKLVDPNEIPDRIIRIVNTSGATGTFINFPIIGLASSSITTIASGKYIVIQSVIDPSSGDRMWAQIGGNY